MITHLTKTVLIVVALTSVTYIFGAHSSSFMNSAKYLRYSNLNKTLPIQNCIFLYDPIVNLSKPTCNTETHLSTSSLNRSIMQKILDADTVSFIETNNYMGKSYKIKKVNGRVVMIEVDYVKIPKDEFSCYDEIINNIKKMHTESREKAIKEAEREFDIQMDIEREKLRKRVSEIRKRSDEIF